MRKTEIGHKIVRGLYNYCMFFLLVARGSLTSPSYLVRDRTLGPPLENNPEIPPVIES